MSWEQLFDIYQQNLSFYQDERDEKANPTFCPVCRGELVEGLNGGLGCRFDGWRQFNNC